MYRRGCSAWCKWFYFKQRQNAFSAVEVLDHQDIKEFRLIQLDPAPQATPPISIMIPCRKSASFCGRLLCFTKNLAIMQFWFETVVGSVFYPWQGWVSVGGWGVGEWEGGWEGEFFEKRSQQNNFSHWPCKPGQPWIPWIRKEKDRGSYCLRQEKKLGNQWPSQWWWL